MSIIACINIQRALLNSKINTRASRLYLTLPIICAIFFKQLTIFRVNVMSLSKRNFGPTPPLWFPFFDTHERETGTIMKKGQWRFLELDVLVNWCSWIGYFQRQFRLACATVKVYLRDFGCEDIIVRSPWSSFNLLFWGPSWTERTLSQWP